MIDEFKIRKQVAGIAASSEPPLRKARLILRLARRVRAAAHALGGHSRRSFQAGDTLRAARMREATDRLIDTHAEIRAHAGTALAEPGPRLDAPGARAGTVRRPDPCPTPTPSSPATPNPSPVASS